MPTPTSPSQPYMLLFRDSGPDHYRRLSPEQRQQLLTRWNAWYDGLVTQGKLTDGRPLEPERRVISGSRGERVVDGPFAEGVEAIGGFFLLTTDDLDEATAIGQQCPGLAYGITVEVRQVAECCPVLKTQRTAATPEAATMAGSATH